MKSNKILRFFLRMLRDWLLIAALGNFLVMFMLDWDDWTLKIVLTNSLFSIGIGYPAMKGMAFLVDLLDKRMPWLEAPLKRLIVQLLSMSLLSALIIFIGFFIWNRVTQGGNFSQVISNVAPMLKIVYIFFFFSLLIGNAGFFFKNWKEAAVKQEELKRAHLALQFQSLKDQVRPHFLFNSLSSLATLINTDTEKATLFVHRLSDVYRYVLEQGENELAPLSEEVKFLEDYIFLQKIRFGNKLDMKVNLDMDLNRMVIPLSLQMLVENAIKHNEISEEKPLLIQLNSNDKMQVLVKNKLQKKEVSEASLGMGLENLKKQIDFFADEDLEVREAEGYFTVKLPTFTVKPAGS